MNVTHVMAAADALGCFPSVIPWPWIQGQVKSAPPTVKWIVVKAPLICGRCTGQGVRLLRSGGISTWHPCTDCKGTALPNVRIVSKYLHPEAHHGGCTKCHPPTIHGVIPIADAVPIFGECPDYKPAHHICHAWSNADEGAWFLHLANEDEEGRTEIQITDQFGDQAVTPGHYAHPILSSTDGTDASTTAA